MTGVVSTINRLSGGKGDRLHAGGRAGKRRVWIRLISILGFVAYPALVYTSLTHWTPRTSALILFTVFIPFTWVRLRSVDREDLKSLAVVPILVASSLLTAALLNQAGLVLIVPVIINGLLCATFGTTLRKGSRPMIERFARTQEKELTEDKVHWCRLWTQIWCLFFVLNGATALALGILASLSWWALYNGFIAYALIGSLFAAEFTLRKFRFREDTRDSRAKRLGAFSERTDRTEDS